MDLDRIGERRVGERLAVQNVTPEQVTSLETVQMEFRAAVERSSAEDMVFWNDRFHFEIGLMAGNHHFMPSLQRLPVDHARIGQTLAKQPIIMTGSSR